MTQDDFLLLYKQSEARTSSYNISKKALADTVYTAMRATGNSHALAWEVAEASKKIYEHPLQAEESFRAILRASYIIKT